MAKCDMCGNDYDRAFQVTTADGRTMTFASVASLWCQPHFFEMTLSSSVITSIVEKTAPLTEHFLSIRKQ